MTKKSPFGNCESCPLQSQGIVIGETNCEDDISKVDVLILAEAPASEELTQGKPLVGTAGKVFREAFSTSKLNTLNYMITNVVLCANIQDGKTVNPPDEAVECCKSNWENLIKLTDPKLILIMGGIPMKAFGINDGGITKIRGNIYKHEDKDVLITLHPSYIKRNGGLQSDAGQLYLNDFKKAYRLISGTPIDTTQPTQPSDYTVFDPQETPYSYQVPPECYKEEMTLFDVQNIRETDTILYTFKTIDGEKKYYPVSSREKYYYTSKIPVIEDAPMLETITNVFLVKTTIHRPEPNSVFESDVRTEIKHAIDYRYNRKIPEVPIKLKKMYADIEVFNNGKRNFPNPKTAPSPINAISWKIDDENTQVWIAKLPEMDQKEYTIPENTEVRFFTSEYKLLTAFFDIIRTTNPEIICGWNFLGFDMPYIFNRAKQLGVDITKMSPVGIVSTGATKYGDIQVYGMHVMCLLDLYKELTYSVEESYKLDYIAKKELGEDFGKVAYVGNLDGLYSNDLSTFLKYSGTDTDILRGLDLKLGHVDLKFELIRICSSTWKAGESTMGLVDPLLLSYAKGMNYVCRNAVDNSHITESIPGAYVRDPVPGQTGFLVDMDFASLYPSIICSMNIGPNTYVGKIDPSVAKNLIYSRDRIKDSEMISLVQNPITKNCKTIKVSANKLKATIDRKGMIVTIAGTIYKSHDEEISFFNKILTYLLDSRKQYKKSMKTAKEEKREDDFKQFSNIQLAYKILANSVYGVLANTNFRMFNQDMAKSVTLTGQEAIKFSGYHIGQYMKKGTTDIDPDFMEGYDGKHIPYLIYTDTDSIFIAIGEYLIDKGVVTVL
jgi:uracil-DNA glycosylase family 4